ncbi:TonB-linked outer membrane protein, SusC/RagA family [Chitinophaga costaii]|uniref:TonB-linked outer membrane protein, SusC/RagA family n=1 Tax=Chitinophaga costaii TaxID=1335309 RepID=A0A1C3Z1J5_9BACT|nr:TonB-dependent receptor [Chitinophaga costaii]PUZ30193.1 TonB-dependent receptor [Chitinophaga costaii]SCB76205.1 TonB-linked outer membrane protein, SusC/RagA family [Chitinophaga costaii]
MKIVRIISWITLVIPLHALSQQVPKPQVNAVVSGKVLDEKTQHTISGATIQIKGVTNSTTSNESGSFSLYTGQKLPFVIVVSCVGYQSKEQQVADTLISVSLSESVQQLSDVVVVGYGTGQRKNLIGAHATVKADEINHLPVASFDAQLQGKAAGVQINSNSGMPGDAVNIRIRGTTSINAGNDPLYIVDGVFINDNSLSTLDLGGKTTSPLADINPTDIENIEVLKDATATAIYGSRGANGVVIITTKRGSYNAKARVSLNVLAGSAWAPKDRWWKLTTGPEHATLVNEQWINSGIDNPALNQNFANRPFRSKAEGGRGLPEEQQTYDRLDDVFRTAQLRNYDLSVSGGTKTTRYYIGGSYSKQEADIRPAAFDRASFKVNLDQKISDRVTVGVSSLISRTFRNQVREGTGPQGGIMQAALHTPTYLPKVNADGTPGRWAGFDNLQVLIDNYNVGTRSLRYIGNFYLDAEILKDLVFHTSWGMDYNNYKESQIWNDKTLIGLAPTNGLVTSSITENATWINEQTLTYKKTFNSKHNFGALLGNTVQSNVLTVNGETGSNFPNNSYTQISAAATRTATQSWTKFNLASFFSRLNYNYDNKYFIEVSARADGSSKFGKNNHWGYFPAAGVAWRLKEESFLQSSKVISDLKLRASYGITGNQNGIGNFAAQGLWTAGDSYPDNTGGADKPGTGPQQLSNTNLKWEKTAQANVGVDVGLFNSRLNITVDVYSKHTTDLLLAVQVPSRTGFDSYTTNAGEISNKGYEVGINSVNIDNGHFTWTTNFTISGNKNLIQKLATPIVYGDRDLIRLEQGHPMYSFWMYKQLYVDPKTGNSVFEDYNHDGQITAADRQILGNASPKFFGGITNTLTYKGFDLSVLFTYQYGNKVVSFDRILGEGGGVKDDSRMILAYNLKRWQQPGDITDVPRVTKVGNNYSIEQNSRFMEDGSFVRIKSLSIGYKFGGRLLNKLGIEPLRIYVLGSNLWLHTKYQGPDPESSHGIDPQGIDVGTPPAPRSLQVGLNATF